MCMLFKGENVLKLKPNQEHLLRQTDNLVALMEDQ